MPKTFIHFGVAAALFISALTAAASTRSSDHYTFDQELFNGGGGLFQAGTNQVAAALDWLGTTSAQSESYVLVSGSGVWPFNTPPIAAPTATPSSGVAPLTVQFAANASDAEGDPLTYSWNFGDGGSSTLEKPSHVFTAAGTYAVTLTVSDGKVTVSKSLTVVVSPGFSFSVRTAAAKFYSGGQGRVALWADIGISVPKSSDVLALDFDGVRLFALPFSAFGKGLLPQTYLYQKNGLIVQLDFKTHRLFVWTPKMAMPGVNNSNGMDVKLTVGSAVGAQNIVMRALCSQLLVYVRPGLCEPPPVVE